MAGVPPQPYLDVHCTAQERDPGSHTKGTSWLSGWQLGVFSLLASDWLRLHACCAPLRAPANLDEQPRAWSLARLTGESCLPGLSKGLAELRAGVLRAVGSHLGPRPGCPVKGERVLNAQAEIPPPALGQGSMVAPRSLPVRAPKPPWPRGRLCRNLGWVESAPRISLTNPEFFWTES